MSKTAVKQSVTTLNKKTNPQETANILIKKSTFSQESTKTTAKTSPPASANQTIINQDSIERMDRLNTANV